MIENSAVEALTLIVSRLTGKVSELETRLQKLEQVEGINPNQSAEEQATLVLELSDPIDGE